MNTKDTLKAVVSPDNATNKTVSYTLSDQNVATMTALTDKSGVGVVASFPGTAKITAKTEENGLIDTANLVVNPLNRTDFTRTSVTKELSLQWTSGGLVWLTGAEVSVTDCIRSQFIQVSPNATYNITLDNARRSCNIFEYTVDKVLNPNASPALNRAVPTFTVQPDTAYIRLVDLSSTTISIATKLTETMSNPNKLYVDSRSGVANLIPNSSVSTVANWTLSSVTASVIEDYITISHDVTTGRGFFLAKSYPQIPVVVGATYTFSADVYIESYDSEVADSSTDLSVRAIASDGTYKDFILTIISGLERGKWHTVTKTGVMDFATATQLRPTLAINSGRVAKIRTKNWKLSMGNTTGYWTMAPEDYGIPHGQPNLLDNSSGTVATASTTNQIGTTVLVPSNDLKIGDSISARVSGTYTGTIAGNLVLRLYNSAGTAINEAYPNNIKLQPGENFSVDFREIFIGTGTVNARIFLIKDTTDSGSTITNLKAKIIRGGLEIMDEWTPSFNDFSAGKYEFNPYRELMPEEYNKVSNMLVPRTDIPDYIPMMIYRYNTSTNTLNATEKDGWAHFDLDQSVITRGSEILPIHTPTPFPLLPIEAGKTYTQSMIVRTDVPVDTSKALELSWYTGATHRRTVGSVKKIGDETYLIYGSRFVDADWDNYNLRFFDFTNIYDAIPYHTAGTYLEFGEGCIFEGTIDNLVIDTSLYSANAEVNLKFDLLNTFKNTYPQEFFGIPTISAQIEKMKSMITKVKTLATISGQKGTENFTEMEIMNGVTPISSETARNRTDMLNDVSLEFDNVLDSVDDTGAINAKVTTRNTGLVAPNLFSLEKFVTECYTHPKQPAVYCVDIQLEPSTTYTLSTTNIPVDNNQNVWFCLPGETPASGVNGVNNVSPRTITTWSDGVVVVGIRKDNVAQGGTFTNFVNGVFDITLLKGDVNAEPIDNLIPNGYGTTGDNTNFPALTYDTVDKPAGVTGAFRLTGLNSTWTTPNTFPVDYRHKYTAKYWVKALTGTSRYYFCFVPFDADGLRVSVPNCGGLATYNDAQPVITRLAKELKVGDTEIWVEDASRFPSEVSTPVAYRSIALWNYVDNSGTNWGTTYTQYVRVDAYDAGAIDYTANKITLRTAWTTRNKLTDDGTFPVGHPISETNNGSTYMYPSSAINTVTPTTYTRITVDTLSATGNRPMNKAIKSLAIGMLSNRTIEDTTWLAGLSVVDSTTERNLGLTPTMVNVEYASQEVTLVAPEENPNATPVTITITPE